MRYSEDVVKPCRTMPDGIEVRSIRDFIKRVSTEPDPGLHIRQINALGGTGGLLNAKIPESRGEGYYDDFVISDDLVFSQLQARFKEDLNYKIVGEGWTRFHFRLSASATLLFDNIAQCDTSGPVCQVLHQPRDLIEAEWIYADTPVHWVTLTLRSSFLAERLGLELDQLPPLLKQLMAEHNRDFGLVNMPLQPEMRRCLADLSRNRYEGRLRRLQLEIKALDLVCMMLGFLNSSAEKQTRSGFSTRDIDALEYARDIINREFICPPTLGQLAGRVGINRNKLSAGFQYMVGKTVAEYCQDLRLTEALQYLRDTDKPVGLIAERVGYARAASFSAAFRKKFQLTPRQVRQGMKPGKLQG